MGMITLNNYHKLLNNLEKLGLLKIKENIDVYVDAINDKKKDIIEALYELTQLELELKEEKAINGCVNVANFPFYKTLDDFDFSFQPTINKDKILEFKNLRFLENKENILFIGSPGVGKTHLATAIGIEAAKNRQITYFIHCNDLVNNLKKAYHENRLEAKLKFYIRYKVLIIDEIGFLPIDKDGANMLFQLINKRYENKSTIITSNIPFSKWADLFGNPVLANAILDRLLHHSHIINITGKSYRTKDVIPAEED